MTNCADPIGAGPNLVGGRGTAWAIPPRYAPAVKTIRWVLGFTAATSSHPMGEGRQRSISSGLPFREWCS